jgi:hypothetical protein
MEEAGTETSWYNKRSTCPFCYLPDMTLRHQAECDGSTAIDATPAEVIDVEPTDLETDFDKAPPPPPLTINGGGKNLPVALISDIDHTLSFPDPAREFMDFSKSESDTPNGPVVAAIKIWYAESEKPTIYFVTNRTVAWRDVTVRWLIGQFSPQHYKWTLRMRPANDFFSSPASIKEGHLEEISKKHSVVQVWEDDDECIAMYRSHGLTVLDAKETWL